jgi:hypothetical protein
MPGWGVHLLLAGRVGAGRLPRSPVARAALLLGAIAPDMGYFPGGDRLASDLAHYVNSAALARALGRLARDDAGRAFAQGWATHVVADAALHPLINRAAGALAGRDTAATYADDPVAHIRVEQGLDAAVTARLGRPAAPRVAGALRRATTALLEAAYRETYGLDRTRLRLGGSVRAAARFCPWLMTYDRVVGWWLGKTPAADRPGSLLTAGFGCARAVTRLAPRSVAFALAHPVAPPDWLLDAVVGDIASFAARFAALEASGFAAVPDSNLDTGEVEGWPPGYPLAARTVRELARRRVPAVASPLGDGAS